MLSHVNPQCLVTDRIPIKLQLTGKPRLIFKFYLQKLEVTVLFLTLTYRTFSDRLCQSDEIRSYKQL